MWRDISNIHLRNQECGLSCEDVSVMWHPSRTFYLHHLLNGLAFGVTATVYSLFLLEIGANYQQLLIVNMAFWGTVVIMELPTGMLADGKSRAWSVKIGSVLTAVSTAVYMLAQNVSGAILAEFILGIGFAFISGALQAWLADSLKRRGEFTYLRKTFATGAMIRAIAILFGGLLGSYVADTAGLRAGMILSFTFHTACAIATLWFMTGEGEPEERVSELEAFRRSWRLLFTHPALGWAMAASVLLGVVALWNMYWSVFFLPRVGQVGLGWIWVALYGAVTIAGFAVRRMKATGGQEEIGLLISVGVTGAGFLFAGFFQSLPLLVLALMVHEAGRGAFDPLLDSFTHHHVDSSHRATYASFQSLLSRFGYVIALGAGAYLTSQTSDSESTIQSMWLISGWLLLAVTAILFLLRPRHAVTTHRR